MIFHKHNFKQEGLNLWCSCGKVKRLKCSHKWKIHSQQTVITYHMKEQIQQILICEKCGDIKSLNLTTGEIN